AWPKSAKKCRPDQFWRVFTLRTPPRPRWRFHGYWPLSSSRPSRHRVRPGSRESLLEESLAHCRHPLDLVFGKLWINRQAQALARGFFGHGKIARLVAEMCEGLLQMQRQRVMHSAADAVGFQVLLQFVAAGVAHDIKMPGTL